MITIDQTKAAKIAEENAARDKAVAARSALFGDGVNLDERIQSAAATPQMRQLLLDIVNLIR